MFTKFIEKHPFLTYWAVVAAIKGVVDICTYVPYAVACCRTGEKPIQYGYRRVTEPSDGLETVEAPGAEDDTTAEKVKQVIGKAADDISEVLSENNDQEEACDVNTDAETEEAHDEY